MDSLLWSDDSLSFLPHSSHEWWHRGVTLVAMLLFGSYADFMVDLANKREKEKQSIYRATVFSALHIINNFLNQSQILRVAATRCEGFSARALASFDSSVQEAQALMSKLQTLEELSEENILSATVPGFEVIADAGAANSSTTGSPLAK